MADTTDPTLRPEYKTTLERLEGLKRRHGNGTDYWLAREIAPILGYPVWAKFTPVIARAQTACSGTGFKPSHHFAQTGKVMGLGKGGSFEGADYYLSRYAAYLVAMNGESSKPEIAAAQTYFAVQTRRSEIHDQLAADEKRLELRAKTKTAVRRVSKQAQLAGVRDHMQGVFHDQRYRGLYEKSRREVNASKGLAQKDNLLDRAGALELSAHDFQMNLTADAIEREGIRGEQQAINKNLAVARSVRQTMIKEGASLPEALALEPPIKVIEKRVREQKRRQIGSR